MAEESAAGLSGQSSADLSAKGLGPWALGAERNTVVAELLKLDPAATQSADLPICLEPLRDQGSAESVTSGALTLGFAVGHFPWNRDSHRIPRSNLWWMGSDGKTEAQD